MFGRSVDKIGILRLKLRTKILDYIGEKVLTPDELESLEYDILEICGVKY